MDFDEAPRRRRCPGVPVVQSTERSAAEAKGAEGGIAVVRWHLFDLVNREHLEKIFQTHLENMGMPGALFDAEDRILLVAGEDALRAQFSRVVPATFSLACREKHSGDRTPPFRPEERSDSGGRHYVLVPLAVEGVSVGVLELGPFRFDDEREEEEEPRAFRPAPVFSREEVRRIEAAVRTAMEIVAALGARVLELRRAEQARGYSEGRFLRFFDEVPDLVLLVDGDGALRQGNDAACRALECSREELQGVPLETVLDVERSGDIQTWIRSGVLFETTFRTRTGETFPVEVRSRLLEESPHGAQVLLFARDVSFRQAREATLARHMALLEAILTAIPLPVFFKDDQGRYQGCNRAFEDLVGYGQEKIRGKTVEDVWPPALAREYRAQDEMLLHSGHVRTFESRVLSASGISRSVLFLKSAYLLPDGRLGGFVGAMLDITDRQQMEQDLREKEARMAALLESANSSIWAVDRELRFLEGNSAFRMRYRQLYGVEVHRGMEILSPQTPPDQRRLWEEHFLRALGGEPCVMELPLEFRETREYREYRFNPIWDAEGIVPTGVVVFSRDTTERRRMEDELRSSLREKETLLREVHHRVKNNLQVVYSLLSLQSVDLEEDGCREVLQATMSRVRSMALIHEHLYHQDVFSRIAMGPYLEELARHMEEIFLDHALLPRFTVESGVELPLDQAVPCGLIATELLTNACKYAFDATGSQSAFAVRVTLELQEEQVALTVADNGRGVPEHWRPEESPSLGFRVVRGLVSQLRGTLSWTSGPGRGLAVTVTFPMPTEKNGDGR